MSAATATSIAEAARELEVAQRQYADVLESYERGRADLLLLRSVAGALSQAHYRLKAAHLALKQERVEVSK